PPSVGGGQVGARGLAKKNRLAADASKGANGRIHAARDVFAGFLVKAHAGTLNSEGARRQVEPHFEAASLCVGRLGRPAMRLHDLRGNCEPDAFSAGIAVTRLGNAIERLENAL